MTPYSYVKDTNLWLDPLGLENWGDYLRRISGTEPPPGMVNPHAHHIVFKVGHPNQQGVLNQSKAILKKHGIDYLHGVENLVWAPNKNHSLKAAERVLEALKKADTEKGTREAVVDALQDMGKKFANGTICD